MDRTQKNRSLAIASPLEEDTLLLRTVTVNEELGRPFEIQLDLRSEDHAIDFSKILGQNVTIRLDIAGGDAAQTPSTRSSGAPSRSSSTCAPRTTPSTSPRSSVRTSPSASISREATPHRPATSTASSAASPRVRATGASPPTAPPSS